MKQVKVFIKKDLIDMWRSYKLMLLISIFTIVGFQNPILAKITPYLIKSFIPELKVSLPEPSILDVWNQFFKNTSQICLIGFLLTFSSNIYVELMGNKLDILLTKGLSLRSVIISKIILINVLWTMLYIVCFGITYLYSFTLFSDVHVNNLFLSISCNWLITILFINVLIFGNVIVINSFSGLVACSLTLFALFSINFVEVIQKYNPIELFNLSSELLKDNIKFELLLWPSTITIIVTLLLIFLTTIIFKNKKL